MSTANRQEPPSHKTGGSGAYGISQILPHPSISNNDSLEDGEIMERRALPQPLLRQLKDEPKVSALTESALPTPENLVPSTVELMTEEDLDRAKSLVLDLLGWGVTPEYLVECGLSQGVIYKIFTDLRLRLPSNLGALSLASSHPGAR